MPGISLMLAVAGLVCILIRPRRLVPASGDDALPVRRDRRLVDTGRVANERETSSWPVATFHARAVLSSLAVRMRCPSGENACQTGVTIRRPSGENACQTLAV